MPTPAEPDQATQSSSPELGFAAGLALLTLLLRDLAGPLPCSTGVAAARVFGAEVGV